MTIFCDNNDCIYVEDGICDCDKLLVSSEGICMGSLHGGRNIPLSGNPKQTENGNLKKENDRLRKLAHILVHCMSSGTECDDCMLNGAKGVTLPIDPLFACDGLYYMLYELGIEVST